MSGQSREAFGMGHRFPLSKSMTYNVRQHIATLQNTDMTGYSFERRPSTYPGAKSDIIVYDAEQKPVCQGREVGDSRAFSFWPLDKA